MTPPCRRSGEDCPRRAPGCQSACAEYAAYDAKRRAARAARSREVEAKVYRVEHARAARKKAHLQKK